MIQRRSMAASYCATQPRDTRPSAITPPAPRPALLRLAARLTLRRGELHRKRPPRPARPRLAPDHVQDQREYDDQKPPGGLQQVQGLRRNTPMEIPKPPKEIDRPEMGLELQHSSTQPPVRLSCIDSPLHTDSSPQRCARDKAAVMTIFNQNQVRPAPSPCAEAQQNRQHEEATDDPTSKHCRILLRHPTGRHSPLRPHGPRSTDH